MDILLEKIFEWIRQGFIEAIMGNFSGMYDTINQRVGDIAGQVGQTPGDFEPGVFSMIRSLSDTAIIPIAGMILTFVMCYELIQMIIEKNNMHDFEPSALYKWIFKTFVAVYIVTHTFEIVMAVFDVAQSVINQSAGIISGNLDVGLALDALQTQLDAMGFWELFGLWMETAVIGLCLEAIGVCVFLIIYGRMIEIYLTVSIAPIPFSTMANREWGQMGNNYLKALFAVAFQGFLIIVCVGIYAALVQGIPTADNIHGAIWGTLGYTVLLCFTLFKTGSLAKSLFSAH